MYFYFRNMYYLYFYYCLSSSAILFSYNKISNYFGCNHVDRNETRGLRNYGTKVRRKIRIREKVA